MPAVPGDNYGVVGHGGDCHVRLTARSALGPQRCANFTISPGTSLIKRDQSNWPNEPGEVFFVVPGMPRQPNTEQQLSQHQRAHRDIGMFLANSCRQRNVAAQALDQDIGIQMPIQNSTSRGMRVNRSFSISSNTSTIEGSSFQAPTARSNCRHISSSPVEIVSACTDTLAPSGSPGSSSNVMLRP